MNVADSNATVNLEIVLFSASQNALKEFFRPRYTQDVWMLHMSQPPTSALERNNLKQSKTF